MTTELADLGRQKALDHIRELLSAHCREAGDAQDDDGKFAVAFKPPSTAARSRRNSK